MGKRDRKGEAGKIKGKGGSMITGKIKAGDRGLYVLTSSGFAIIDRNFLGKVKEGEEWYFEEVRRIKDRKGREVPILKPTKRKEELSYDYSQDAVIITSGDRTIEEIPFEEAKERGIVKLAKEEKYKRPFMEGTKYLKYVPVSADGLPITKEEKLPLTEEEERAIEADRRKWLSYLEKNKEEIEREREKYNSLRKRMKELRDEITSLESYLRELKKSPEIYRRFNFNAFEVEYLFTLTEDEKPVVYEIHRDTTPKLHYPGGRFEDYDGDDQYFPSSWNELPFSEREKEAIRRSLFQLLKEKKEKLPIAKKELEEKKKELERVERELEKIDRNKLRAYKVLSIVRNPDEFKSLEYLEFPLNAVNDEEFIKSLPFEICSPQGFAVAMIYLNATPQSLLEIMNEDIEEFYEALDAYLNWFKEIYQVNY